MKAAFYLGGERIRIGDCAASPPGPGQVQIHVSHCGICGTDLHLFHGKMDHRVTLPQVIGHEMAGTIHALGEAVTEWKPGDRVTVRPLDPCGACPACKKGHSHICHKLKFIGIDAPGAMQGLWTVPSHTLHRLPEKLSLEHGALIEPLAVACHDVRLGGVTAGDFVVVQGGGPIGVLVASVAKNEGARVLLTEVNAFRLQLAASLGLEVVNPRETDVLELVNRETDGAGADVVFEVSGSPQGADMMTKLARTRGRIVVVAIFAEQTKVDLFRFFWRELQLTGARVYEPQDFEKAIAIAASSAIHAHRLITDIVPLEGLEGALRQMESGGEVMKILVQCSG